MKHERKLLRPFIEPGTRALASVCVQKPQRNTWILYGFVVDATYTI
jgi:hypothetical protein